jgi:alkylhydroperoxidase family enzyme
MFDSKQCAVLAFTDAMTREVRVTESVFAEVRAHFDEHSIVELAATVAAYNMVSRFLETPQIQIHDVAGSADPAAHG